MSVPGDGQHRRRAATPRRAGGDSSATTSRFSGIDRVRPAVVRAAHGVGTAQHQAANQPLLRPAVRDEPQSRVRRAARGGWASRRDCRSNRPSGRSPRRTALARCDSRRPARSAGCRRWRSSRPVAGDRFQWTGSTPAGFATRHVTNPRGTGSPSAWALPRIVIRMSAGLLESCTAKATGSAGVKNSACSMSLASLPTRASQLSPFFFERLPGRRVDGGSPPGLVLALEDRVDLRDAVPCPLTFGLEVGDGMSMPLEPGFAGSASCAVVSGSFVTRRPAPYAPLGPCRPTRCSRRFRP